MPHHAHSSIQSNEEPDVPLPWGHVIEDRIASLANRSQHLTQFMSEFFARFGTRLVDPPTPGEIKGGAVTSIKGGVSDDIDAQISLLSGQLDRLETFVFRLNNIA